MKEVLETVIEDLVNNFNFETLQEFFYLKVKDRWKEYREPLPSQYEDDLFVEVWRVGEFNLIKIIPILVSIPLQFKKNLLKEAARRGSLSLQRKF